jgi:phosphoheptose isomerase
MKSQNLASWQSRAQLSAAWIKETLDNTSVIAQLLKLADLIVYPYKNELRYEPKPLIMTAGNGGSHALAEHLTAELIWRISREAEIRIPSICLTSNSSVLTALSNDSSYEQALTYYAGTLNWLSNESLQPILIAFSTSGASKNILYLSSALTYDHMAHRVLFTGEDKGEELPADDIFYVKGPGDPTTAIIQEVHQVYVHMLCEMISEKLNE